MPGLGMGWVQVWPEAVMSVHQPTAQGEQNDFGGYVPGLHPDERFLFAGWPPRSM